MTDLVKTRHRKLDKINKGNKAWIETTFFNYEKVVIHCFHSDITLSDIFHLDLKAPSSLLYLN